MLLHRQKEIRSEKCDKRLWPGDSRDVGGRSPQVLFKGLRVMRFN